MREIVFGSSFALLVAIAALASASWPVSGRPVAVFFRSGASSGEVMAAIQHAGGLLLEADAESSLVISISDQRIHPAWTALCLSILASSFSALVVRQ
jgi:hypothetical protein